jgi:hypothetical protein
MLNPHQNININISYNLGTDKVVKQLPAKKIIKTQKANHTHFCNTSDLEPKFNRKGPENNLKKSNEQKQSNDNKKTLKKKNIITRNAITPEIFNDRRVRTEGPSADQEIPSAFKK